MGFLGSGERFPKGAARLLDGREAMGEGVEVDQIATFSQGVGCEGLTG